MITKNALGVSHTAASPAAIADYEAALVHTQQFTGDPVGLLDKAIADSPSFTMAHAAKAWLYLIGTDAAPRDLVRESLPQLEALSATPREAGHIAAIGALANGGMRKAARILEDVAIDEPRDILAVQVGHLLDLMVGDTRMLRDRPARALHAWTPDMPRYSALLGMLSFGHEETGDYARAEGFGRRAIDLDPRDSWAQHAVAHVLEMQGRPEDGLDWMISDHARWSEDNFFRVHNWWHTALFHMELGEINQALALYDGPIFGSQSQLVYDLLDASALLWRLHLRGVDIGDRAEALADIWVRVGTDTRFGFNDTHAAAAFALAGRIDAIEMLRASQATAASKGGDYATTLEIGRPVSEAYIAFARGDYESAVELLRPVRNIAHRFGGSHAQRDLIDLTLIEAAIRSGQTSLARALASERKGFRPDLASTAAFMRRALTAGLRTAAE